MIIGTWAFPGGRVEAGEHPLATAIREVYEETGIDISKNTPIYGMSHVCPTYLYSLSARIP